MYNVYIDEVGRGCLAGPVVAAAVILPDHDNNPLFGKITDSKKVLERNRRDLARYIKDIAIDCSVGEASVSEIDEINILQATFIAMHRALDQIKEPISHIYVDGNTFKPYKNIPHTCIVGGDAIMKGIGAASIIAKVYRDDMMDSLSVRHPEYLWHKNKGYGTKAHIEAINEHGITPYHRLTFAPISNLQCKI